MERKIITNLSVAEIKKTLALFKVAVSVLTETNIEGKAGAVLNICSRAGIELLHERCGTAPEEKFHAYEHNALDKNLTLQENLGHRLSFQSRDMEHGPYPGAIRALCSLLVSISGFTWEEDEAAVFWICTTMGWDDRKEEAGIISISGNKSMHALLPRFDAAWKETLVS